MEFAELPAGASLAIELSDMARSDVNRDRALMALFERPAGNLLLTARSHPSEWALTIADLKSRYDSLLAFPVWAPDDALLTGLIRKHFSDRQLEVADAVVARLLTHLERSPEAIAAFIARSDEKARAEKRAVTERLVLELIDIESSNQSAELYWIDVPLKGRLAIMARPRAGDWLRDEVARWGAENIGVVVCLLEHAEIVELELGKETDLCREAGIEFISFPIRDRGVPSSLPGTVELARLLAGKIESGKAVAIHCRAGIGRSAVIAACVLVCAGTEASATFDIVSAARGLRVPDTEEQSSWLQLFHDAQRAS
jgi:protein-tyrosine phosphatase